MNDQYFKNTFMLLNNSTDNVQNTYFCWLISCNFYSKILSKLLKINKI